ncbi:MAG: ribulose-phosphate 3-epimerase [Nanoarchaeota archaeon]
MRKIIPTILAHNKEEFNKRFEKLIKISKNLHIDFMDGKFVKSTGIKISQIPNLKNYNINFEAHLMTINPGKYLLLLKKKGFKKIIFHYEAIQEGKIISIIKKIKSNNMKAIIALNPETQINNIIPFLNKISGVLVMGVYPGKENQKFISKVYEKIKGLRKINKKINIHVDGGVNLSNIKKLKMLGVNCINSGSFISNSIDPKRALRHLEKSFI